MDDIVIASSEADAAAAEAVEQHHAQMAGTLATRVETLVAAASRGDAATAVTATSDLSDWCERELLPHALAEEKSLYVAAQGRDEARLLVDGMLAEHVLLVGLVRELGAATDIVRAAATATALQTLFESHLDKENHLVLPLLVGDPGVSVADLLAGMHELLGAPAGDSAQGGCGHGCSCGEVDGSE